MKMKYLLLGLVSSAIMASCGGEKPAEDTADAATTEETTETTASEEAKTYNVNAESSKVEWKGSAMAGAYAHTGTLNLKSGSLMLSGESITGGSFEVDLTSMAATDENYTEEKKPEMLIGHLSSPDFFDVPNFPTAKFTIKSVAGNEVTGDLEIRGKVNEEKVTISNVMVEEGMVSAEGSLTFDRQKYDVAYQSDAKDFVISDDIELSIAISAAAE